jgi:hypothetical protein
MKNTTRTLATAAGITLALALCAAPETLLAQTQPGDGSRDYSAPPGYSAGPGTKAQQRASTRRTARARRVEPAPLSARAQAEGAVQSQPDYAATSALPGYSVRPAGRCFYHYTTGTEHNGYWAACRSTANQ